MSAKGELFRVTNPWGGEIVLTQQASHRIKEKRPGVDGYQEHVRKTLEEPNLVFEGKYQDSKVFYRKGLLDDDPDFTACYVAVVVRYASEGTPGTIRTVYFPYHVQGALGNCSMLVVEGGER
jgi:hypothetical protein